MTNKRYLAEQTRYSCEAVVTAIIPGDQPVVRLSETLFHPQGGGQKADRGTIGTAKVTHVAHNAGDVDHFVDSISSLKVGDTYPIQVDVSWRRLNATYHTAGHLIASVVEDKFPEFHALAGHQWPGEARVEFEGNVEDYSNVQNVLDDELRKKIADAVSVKIIGDPYTSRSIQIGDYSPIPCGGTHVANLSEIGMITIDGVRKKSGKLRISYGVTNNTQGSSQNVPERAR
jgi:alanyl-tRNA synthetase